MRYPDYGMACWGTGKDKRQVIKRSHERSALPLVFSDNGPASAECEATAHLPREKLPTVQCAAARMRIGGNLIARESDAMVSAFAASCSPTERTKLAFATSLPSEGCSSRTVGTGPSIKGTLASTKRGRPSRSISAAVRTSTKRRWWECPRKRL